MDQGHELVPGPALPGGHDEPAHDSVAAEVRVRRLSRWESLLLRAALVVLGGALLLVLLPVIVIFLVLLTAYIAGVMVYAAMRGRPRPAMPDLRRNVRVRGPARG